MIDDLTIVIVYWEILEFLQKNKNIFWTADVQYRTKLSTRMRCSVEFEPIFFLEN